MSKSVEDGIVKLLSPSMINKFDAAQPFGCERRWWYRYVKGLDEPQTGNQELGEKLHALIEHRLLTGETPAVYHDNDEVLKDAAGIYLAGQAMIESVAQRTIIGVERALPRDFTVDGTPFSPMSKCDVVLMDGIIDWKTSSDINRYGKTERDLATDTQMVLYALAFHPTTETVKLAHGQFQTRGRKATNFVEVEVTDKHLADHRNNVIVPLIQKMKGAASESDVRKLPRNEKSCFNCHYKPHCPTAEGENIMSFFSKMKQSTPEVQTQPVLPPDAPKSEPAKAADPVEGFSPVPAPRRQLIVEAAPSPSADLAHEAPKPTPPPAPEAPAEPVKRGRGRPAGSKNKPKHEVSLPASATPEQVAQMQADRDANPPKVTLGSLHDMPMVIKSRTVTKGYTVNVGAFNSVRFDFSATAEGGTDEELRDYVDSVLEAEVSKYQAEVDAKNKVSVPAKEVVLK